MATLVALPYSHQHYDNLPNIMDAATALNSSGFFDRLATSIGSVFINHGVENLFGLILLHRHFDMEPTEMLVEFGNVSVPWSITCNKTQLGHLRPISWRFLPEGIVPYEFTSNKAILPSEGQDYGLFVHELGSLLREMHLDQLLGLCKMDDSDQQIAATMEFTSGRANVTVPDVMWALDNEHSAVEASWQFGSRGTTHYTQGYHDTYFVIEGMDVPGPVVFKKCKNKCEYKGTTGQHTQRHLTTNK